MKSKAKREGVARRGRLCVLALWVLASVTGVRAEVQLPTVLGDGMVLQRDKNVAVWGRDAPNTPITVSFRGQAVATVCDATGAWMARVPSGSAGGPFEMSIAGSNRVMLRDVLVGEVWIAGGQSNMWWQTRNAKDAEKEIARANDPQLRVYDANTGPQEGGWRAEEPQFSLASSWQRDTPGNAGEFPSTAYFFARELRRVLKVPVGLVHVAVPGAEIEAFLPRPYLSANLPQTLELLDLNRASYPARRADWETSHAAWERARDNAKTRGEAVPEEPKAPEDPTKANSAARLWNGTVAPTVPFTCRGFVWWQGEANTSRASQYRVLFPGLIQEWRTRWNDDELPFLFVELANFGFRQDVPVRDDGWSALRDAQRDALRLPKTYEVSAIDVLDPEGAVWNIHPLDKQLIGHRLSLAALANVYGQRAAWSGPRLRAASFRGGVAALSFDHVGGGLTIRSGQELQGFALAGSDHVWHWAQARLENQANVMLSSREVPVPVAARYAWHINPNGNLGNREGLPAFPFRTDSWNLYPQ